MIICVPVACAVLELGCQRGVEEFFKELLLFICREAVGNTSESVSGKIPNVVLIKDFQTY